MPTPGPPNPNVFDPPTPAQVQALLDANPPMQPGGWRARLPQIVLIGAGLLMVLALIQPGLVLLPLLALIGAMVYLSNRARALQERQQRVQRAWELAMIRRYRDALGEAWRLLPECKSTPELHGRVVTVMAHILGELRQDEAADIALGYLLDRLPEDHPLALRLRLQRATVALEADRLADADDALRKLRGQRELERDPSLAGAYALARLLQDARTGHYADAIEHAEDTAEALKPLGVEAGYGHGLLALCYHQLAQRAATPDAAEGKADGQTERQATDHAADATRDAQRLREAVRRWWDGATILIPPAALTFRFPELAALPGSLKKGSGVVPVSPDTVSDDPSAGGDA